MNLRPIIALAIVIGAAPSARAITIGPGPVIGIDKRGTSWYQEFQDWSAGDVRALDTNGDQLINDANSSSRDIVAFYAKDDGASYAFRLDFFDLGFGAENGGLDAYVLIDCASGGRTSFPDSVRCNIDPTRAWDIAVKLYSSVYRFVEDSSGTTLTTNYPTHWNSQLDTVEFSIPRSFLTGKGWDRSSPIYFHVATTRDFSNTIADVIGTYTAPGANGNGQWNGAIASSSSASRAKYAVIAHANQSVGTRTGTQKHIFTANTNFYPGFVRLLDSAEMFNLPINLHISGTLMMSFLWAAQDPSEPGYPNRDGPTFMKRCKDFVTTGPGSLIGGVLAEHIMPYFEGEVNRKSIEQNSELIQHYFGLSETDMKVMHVPERVIRSQTNHPNVSASGPLDGKTFEEIEQSGYIATYLDEVAHLHWWFYPDETNNPGWDNNNCGRWAGGLGNDEEPYHHKIHKINGVYTFMINDREDQSKFGNDDNGMALDTRATLLQKALHPDAAQITIVFDDWEALAGNSFASPDPNNNADQFHRTLRWAANKPWIEFKNLRDVVTWAQSDTNWVIDHGYVYNKTSETYEWLKRASEHTYDNWYYGSALEESFFNRTAAVHNAWSPSGMKKYGDMNTPGTLIRDSWDAIQQISSPYLKKISEWSYSAMIYETAWHDEDANPDQYKSRNYQMDFNRGTAQGNCDTSVADTTYDVTSGWAVRLHGHVRDMGVMKAASDWVSAIKSGAQTATTTVYAADIDDDTLSEYVLCNDKAFVCIERWGARVIKAFVYDPHMNGGDARMVIGAPISNPAEESENEGANNSRNSAFKDHWSTGQSSHKYIDDDYAHPVAPVRGDDYWEFVSSDGLIRKRLQLPAGRDVVIAHYNTSSAVGTVYVRHGFGPNQIDLMLNGTNHLSRRGGDTYRGLLNVMGGEVYVSRGPNTALNTGSVDGAGWDRRELPMTEVFEASNHAGATNFTMALAFSERSAGDIDADGIPDTWEYANGLNVLTNDSNDDLDGDGIRNGDEYIAGTVANNSASFFALSDTWRNSNNLMLIQYTAASGRFYRALFADGLQSNQWAWRPFSSNYYHAQPEGAHAFTDDFTSATSGGAPTSGVRAYTVDVFLP